MTLVKDVRLSFLLGTVLLSSLLSLVPATADAQRRDDEARALYSAGEIAFSEGRYEYALVHFQRAYELSPRPILLFNIGASAERLNRDALALSSYEQYLHELPDAPNRRVVAARIVLLRQALHAAPARSPDTAAADDPDVADVQDDTHVPEETDDSNEPDRAVAPWIVVGLGSSAVVLGAVFLGLGTADAAAVRDLPDGTAWPEVADEYERAPRRQTAGLALLGVGTVAIVTGVVLAVTGGRDAPAAGSSTDTPRVTGWIDRRSAGVVASGSF